MPKTVITLPCTAQDLESALHAVCDHHGLWNGRIDTMCDGSDSGDACVSIVLSEGSGESSPSPSSPTSPAPTCPAPTEAVGDAAAMREALIRCATLGEYCFQDIHAEVANVSRAALAKPPRNCDVGTAEEQARRFRTFCASHFDKINCKCGDCPAKYHIDGWGLPYCQLKWAQMPYEEGGAR